MANALDLLFFVGRPFSPIYALAMHLRSGCYRRGIVRQQKLPVPVISVGNLVLGGTGKTPVVQHIARLLQQKGFRPAVVSRGYRGRAAATVNIVSDYQQIFLSAVEAGDEPFLLAKTLPGVPVLTGRRRLFPARQAIERYQVDAIILDDGFQHLGLYRDIDLVLFDAGTQAGNSRVFPGGPLREPISALQRCDAFLLTGRTPQNEQRAALFAALLEKKFPHAPTFFSNFDRPRLLDPAGRCLANQGKDERYLAFCGIANPHRFQDCLHDLDLPLAGFMSLADHQRYSPAMLERITAKAQATGAGRLVTTEKDFVKLAGVNLPLPIYRLEVDQKVDAAFDQFLDKMLATR
jgi:tetraacyldisaccharide 4'-kinase